jgi:hypothetical protein
VLATTLVLGAAALAPAAAAGPPGALSYQGVLTDGAGVVVRDGTYGLEFQVLDQPMGGTLLFEQTLSAQVVDGLYNVILTSAPGMPYRDLAAAFEEGGFDRYMQVTITSDGNGVLPVPLVLAPRQQIASVPYALVAGRADRAGAFSGTRQVQFATSADRTRVIGQSGWTSLVEGDGATTLDLATTPPAPGCTIQVEGIASFYANGKVVYLTVLENGSAVGVPHVLDADGAKRMTLPAQYVNRTPTPNTTYTHSLGARASDTGVKQGDLQNGVESGVSLRVLLDCAAE